MLKGTPHAKKKQVTVGAKVVADDDDEAFFITTEWGGHVYGSIVGANPDDEDDEPAVRVLGPFGTLRQAQKFCHRKREIIRKTRKMGDLDAVPGALRKKILDYVLFGAQRLKIG
jgi:hypothetical protein